MNKKKWTQCLTLLLTTLVAGCATAYHCYSGCRIDCRYCPPPPLPYAPYRGHACHSCAAEPYLQGQTHASEQVHSPDSIEPIESRDP